jgi:DtxR family transcriptional regulator, Mn-dependent transcriptional regulator
MPNPLTALLIATTLAAGGLLLFWPETGLWGRWRRSLRLGERVAIEDALKHIYKCEVNRRQPTVDSLAGALQITHNRVAGLLTRMEALALLQMGKEGLRLTPKGRESALHILRAHRLWERYLAEETGFSEAEWHGRADRQEHALSPSEADALAAQLGNPTHDPHGDPIPSARGRFQRHGGRPLTAVEGDELLRIVHLEDEPEAVYAQLVAEGLHVGMPVRVVERTPQRIHFWADGDEHVLAPLIAANISVVSLAGEAVVEPGGEPLANLSPGQQGRVTGISPTCRGPRRRRLMDLGVLPGTCIEAEFSNPSGDPTAYRIRGAVIALRREEAGQILVERTGQEETVPEQM